MWNLKNKTNKRERLTDTENRLRAAGWEGAGGWAVEEEG